MANIMAKKLVSRSEIREFVQRFSEMDHYEAIGEFIYKFSQLEFLIKYRLFKSLELRQELFDIITGPYDFAMLCTVSAETLKSTPGISDDKKKVIEKYFNACKAFNQENRVVVAHASWSLSGARHVKRNSLKADMHFPDAKDVKAKSQEITKLMLRISETNI